MSEINYIEEQPEGLSYKSKVDPKISTDETKHNS